MEQEGGEVCLPPDRSDLEHKNKDKTQDRSCRKVITVFFCPEKERRSKLFT